MATLSDQVKKRNENPPIGETPAIILNNPKYVHNVGGIIRAASSWGIKQVWITGKRVFNLLDDLDRLPREERMKGYYDVSWQFNDRPFDYFRNKHTVVGVELLEGSSNIMSYQHNKNTIYVFGPEDGSIQKTFRMQCHSFVFLPTAHCLNLSAAVNVVMYDRSLKLSTNKYLTLDEYLKEDRGFIE